MKSKMTTKQLTLASILTAIVFALQYFGCVIKFGTFSISTVLIPIVIGAAACGTWVAAWLGLVFGIAVLASGDAALFLAASVPGTIITVILKGVGCGVAAGLVYNAMRGVAGEFPSVIAAAIACPVANTGIFLIGCKLFFMDVVTQLAETAGWEDGIFKFMIIAFVGLNFLVEMCINIFLAPIVVRLLKIK